MSTRDIQREQKITQNIMQQIRSGKATIRPHWQLALIASLGAVGLTAATIATIYLVNLVAFKLRLASTDRPMYRMQANLDYYAGSFPWLAFVLGLFSLGSFIWLVRKHDFSYRFGRWLLTAVILVSLVVGTTLAFTSLNNHLENFGPMRGIYGKQMHGSQKSGGQNNSKGTPRQDGGGMMQRHGQ